MSTILIIGANRGLGLEWVKYYKKMGHTVLATARDLDAAIELKELLTEGDKLIKLDLEDDDSIESAMAQILEAPDITIYNAGVKGYIKPKNSDEKVTLANATLIEGDKRSRREGRRQAFRVNAEAFDQVVYELQEKLLAKPEATLVYITTGVADTEDNTGGGYPFYRESKAAGEAFARNWDITLFQEYQKRHGGDYKDRPRVFSILPGLVDVGMGKDVKGAVAPGPRIEEMAMEIEKTISNGNTHAVHDYKGIKREFKRPDGMPEEKLEENKNNTSPPFSEAELLTKNGIYKTEVNQNNQGSVKTGLDNTGM